MPDTVAPNYIDLFAGAGGISLGLANSGWKGIFAIEKSDLAFKTLEHNLIKTGHFDWPDWLSPSEHNIDEVLNSKKKELSNLKGKVDLVAGGPPCQGFSLAGRRSHNDERNKLVHSYIDFIQLVHPRIVFLENVTGFTTGLKYNEQRDRAYSEFVKEKLEILGYNVAHDIINFSKYGVPQKRRRFILIGLEKGDPERFFNGLDENIDQFLKNRNLQNSVTLGEAISDLEKKHGFYHSSGKRFEYGYYGLRESKYQRFMRKKIRRKKPDSHRFANHKVETIERWGYILQNCRRNTDIGDDVKSKFNLKKHSIIPLDKDDSSPTLTTLPDDYIHYSEPRILTVREYARIQSFPDWYEIKGKYTTGGKRRIEEVPRYSQLGNAVPPLFTELAGLVLKERLNYAPNS
jgi:DNA (cytosine-5)-methyltransferase 1